MPDPNLVRVNHTLYSWTSSAFQVNGSPQKGVVGVSYEQTRERKVVYGARQDGRPLGKTSGKYSVKGFTIKMLKDSADALTTDLTVLGLGSYGDAEFTFTAQCIEPVPGAVPLIVVASTCTIDGKKDSYEEGIDELVTEFDIGCLEMTENGKRLWSVVRSLGG